MRNIESFDKLQWKANLAKLESGWGSIDNATLEMKKQWKTVFNENFNDAMDAILSNSTLRQKEFPGLNDPQVRVTVENWISTSNDKLYKFIIVE